MYKVYPITTMPKDFLNVVVPRPELHKAAITNPSGGERVILDSIQAWLDWADIHYATTGRNIGSVTGEFTVWYKMGVALRALIGAVLASCEPCRLSADALIHVIDINLQEQQK